MQTTFDNALLQVVKLSQTDPNTAPVEDGSAAVEAITSNAEAHHLKMWILAQLVLTGAGYYAYWSDVVVDTLLNTVTDDVAKHWKRQRAIAGSAFSIFGIIGGITTLFLPQYFFYIACASAVPALWTLLASLTAGSWYASDADKEADLNFGSAKGALQGGAIWAILFDALAIVKNLPAKPTPPPSDETTAPADAATDAPA